MLPNNNNMIVTLVLIIIFYFVGCDSALRVGFYAESCPSAEAMVRSLVRGAIVSDPNMAAVLLRLHFHDCFVQGCEGSILIDNGLASDERHAPGHLGVQGFDVIERVKTQVESACPGIVSCADIVAMAARDAIALARGPSYEVETGRRDGSSSNVTLADMPEATNTIEKLKNRFFEKGLTEKDLVVLSGAHTIGRTACFFMKPRLYKFSNGMGPDPSINPAFLSELKSTCPQNGDPNVRVPMDRGSGQTFDNQILENIRSGFAVLQSDASLYQDVVTRNVIDSYFGLLAPLFGPSFEADFVNSMVRMGRIGVLTGRQGTIRRVCSYFK